MNIRFSIVVLGLLLAWVQPASAAVLAKFDDVSAWQLITSPQVSGSVRPVAGNNGRALCLDYDFHEVSGYVAEKTMERAEEIVDALKEDK